MSIIGKRTKHWRCNEGYQRTLRDEELRGIGKVVKEEDYDVPSGVKSV